MTATCETCGQDVDEHLDDGSAPNGSVTNDAVIDTRPGLLRFLPVLLVGVLAAAAAAVLWNQITEANEADGGAEVPEMLDDEPSEVSLAVVETRKASAAAGIGGIVSYLSNEGMVVLNLDSGDATIFEVQADPVGMTGRLLVASVGDKTYRVDPRDPRALSTLSAFGVAVPTSISRIVNLVFEPSNEPGRLSAMTMSLDGGVVGEAFPVPVGSQIEVIDHFGMVIHPAAGGTYEFTRDGAELLSSNQVVAIADDVRVEVKCDDALVCEHLIVGQGVVGSAQSTLGVGDPSGQSEISLAPDGSRLVAFDEGGLLAFALGDPSEGSEDRAPVVEPLSLASADADGAVAWSRDSERFAWLSSNGRVLTFADRDGVELARLDLRALGLPPANGARVVLDNVS